MLTLWVTAGRSAANNSTSYPSPPPQSRPPDLHSPSQGTLFLPFCPRCAQALGVLGCSMLDATCAKEIFLSPPQPTPMGWGKPALLTSFYPIALPFPDLMGGGNKKIFFRGQCPGTCYPDWADASLKKLFICVFCACVELLFGLKNRHPCPPFSVPSPPIPSQDAVF